MSDKSDTNVNKTAGNTGKNRGLANLKPWVKGESGNPNGRPKGTYGFERMWDLAIAKIAEEEHITKDQAEANLMVAAYKQAKRGNALYFRELMDRKFGKPEGFANGPTVVMPILGGTSVSVNPSDEENPGDEKKD